MSELLTKDTSVALPRQLRDLIVQRIDQGRYRPGRKLDSIRKLAEEFSVSTLVVIQALNLLEQQNIIVRVPAKGVFVAEDYRAGLTTARIAFAFPESTISPELMSAENWAIVSEIHRGLLTGAITHQAQVRFEHFPEAQSELQLTQQLRRLDEFDAAVFAGRQLKQLRLAAASRRPVIQIRAEDDAPPGRLAAIIDYDSLDAMRQLVSHVLACGYTRCGVLTLLPTDSAQRSASFRARAQVYRQAMREQGCDVPESLMWEVDAATPIVPQVIERFRGRGDRPNFLFCNHAEHVVDLYRAAQALGLTLGRDLGVACIASGFTLQAASPRCTFIKTPLVQMGQTAIDVAMQILAQNPAAPLPPALMLKATLVQGQTTVEVS